MLNLVLALDTNLYFDMYIQAFSLLECRIIKISISNEHRMSMRVHSKFIVSYRHQLIKVNPLLTYFISCFPCIVLQTTIVSQKS